MNGNQPLITEETLQRLRPSDMRAIADHVHDRAFLLDLLLTFQSLMQRMSDPFASELDDVARIALQLKMADVWTRIDPQAFAGVVARNVRRPVFRQLLDTLGVDETSVVPAPGRLSRYQLKEILAKPESTGAAPNLDTW